MRKSLILWLLNILSVSLSSALIWCLTNRDLIATLVLFSLLFLNFIGMLASYFAQVRILQEQLDDRSDRKEK